jgi:uncharacterized repeat protein (TIGR03803 family)
MMKHKMNLLCGAALIFWSAFPSVQAQTNIFKSVYGFTATPSYPNLVNGDGAGPDASLILSGNTLFGTSYFGGSGGVGTVFRVNTDGTDFTNLHNFTSGDGANLDGSLVLSGNTLYGTAHRGGSAGNGTVFRVNTDGTDFTNLYSFTALTTNINSDGANPKDGLTLSGNVLYGTAVNGGSGGSGTVFRINTDGTDFTNLHSFTATSHNGSYVYTNSDGASPDAGLILSGNVLYGTASVGGTNANGTVFRINTDGTDFTNLYTFTALASNTNSDGAGPDGGLILSGNTLFGTAMSGGNTGNGTLFGVNTDGTGFTNLHSFTAGGFNSSDDLTNGDGAFPVASLILWRNTLYGTTQYGGLGGNGTVFGVNTNGSNFTNLYSFTEGSTNSAGEVINGDGAFPIAGLILGGTTLYGTTEDGGANANGTLFALTLPVPSLWIALANHQAVVYWPAWATNYTLQISTNLSSSGGWINVTSGIGIVGTNFVFTNTSTSQAAFFRLQSGTVSAPSVPSLGIAIANHQAVISWPTWATSYTLEMATNMTSGIWSNITSGIGTAGTNYVFTNTTASQTAYYRLEHQ